MSFQEHVSVGSRAAAKNSVKKRGTGKKLLLTIRAIMLEEHVDVVAGDFRSCLAPFKWK